MVPIQHRQDIEDAVIRQLQVCAGEIGHAPSSPTFSIWLSRLGRRVADDLGGWDALLKAAELFDQKPQTDDPFIVAYRRIRDRAGKPPTQKLWQDERSEVEPSVHAIKQKFGRWSDFVKAMDDV